MSTPITSLSRLQELLPQMFQATELPGRAYLRFQLALDITGLFAMERVRESLLVPAGKITPLPNMPQPVLGVMSSRNHAFCVVELAELLGLRSSLVYSRHYHVIVVGIPPSNSQEPSSNPEQLLGIAVNRIQGMTRLVSENIHSPKENISYHLIPYLQGCAIEKEEQLLVFDVPAIVSASLLYE